MKWFDTLRPKLETLSAAYGIPLGLPVGWIEEESGGNIRSTTSLDERGYFQLMPDESAQLHLDHKRLSYDIDYSLNAGYQLINMYCSKMDRWGIITLDKNTELYFRLCKFVHSIGEGAARVIISEASKASAMATWGDFKAYCHIKDGEYLHRFKHSPVKWIGMVDRVFSAGAPYGFDLMCI